MQKKKYEWITTSSDGFVRYLVANILPHGYRFYVVGSIKPTRDLAYFDRVMQEKFHYSMSRSQRNRRKSAQGPDGKSLDLANIHYLRRERYYLLIATLGAHSFYDHHTTRNADGHVINKHFRDAHRDPIFFEGYSIRTVAEGGYRPKRLWRDPEVPEFDAKPRVRVQIARETFLTLQADFLERAKSRRWEASDLEAAIWNLPFMPYRPVREQLWGLVRRINRVRKQRGFKTSLDPNRCIRKRIPAVRAFAEPCSQDSLAA